MTLCMIHNYKLDETIDDVFQQLKLHVEWEACPQLDHIGKWVWNGYFSNRPTSPTVWNSILLIKDVATLPKKIQSPYKRPICYQSEDFLYSLHGHKGPLNYVDYWMYNGYHILSTQYNLH